MSKSRLLYRTIGMMTFYAALFSVESASAANIRVPLNCHNSPTCWSDIDWANAQKSWRRGSAWIKKECKSVPMTNKEEFQRRGQNFCNNFQSGEIEDAVYQDGCDRDADSYGIIWAPSNLVKNGQHLISAVLDRVQTGSVEKGEMFVMGSDSPKNEHHMARCKTRSINASNGPPSECITVIVEKNGKHYIRSNDGSHMCPNAASIRTNNKIDIEFAVDTSLSPNVLAQKIKTVLESELDLKAEMENDSASNDDYSYAVIKTQAPLRASKILENYSEIFDFDVFIRKHNGKTEISANTQPLISRQPVSTATLYHGLGDAERGIYATKLNMVLEQAIKSACTEYKRIDDRRLLCK